MVRHLLYPSSSCLATTWRVNRHYSRLRYPANLPHRYRLFEIFAFAAGAVVAFAVIAAVASDSQVRYDAHW